MEENRQIWSRIVVCNNSDFKHCKVFTNAILALRVCTAVVVLHRQIFYRFKTWFLIMKSFTA